MLCLEEKALADMSDDSPAALVASSPREFSTSPYRENSSYSSHPAGKTNNKNKGSDGGGKKNGGGRGSGGTGNHRRSGGRGSVDAPHVRFQQQYPWEWVGCPSGLLHHVHIPRPNGLVPLQAHALLEFWASTLNILMQQ